MFRKPRRARVLGGHPKGEPLPSIAARDVKRRGEALDLDRPTQCGFEHTGLVRERKRCAGRRLQNYRYPLLSLRRDDPTRYARRCRHRGRRPSRDRKVPHHDHLQQEEHHNEHNHDCDQKAQAHLPAPAWGRHSSRLRELNHRRRSADPFPRPAGLNGAQQLRAPYRSPSSTRLHRHASGSQNTVARTSTGPETGLAALQSRRGT